MVMARFRRSSIHPVSRVKHVVDNSATVTAGTSLIVNVAQAVDAPTLAATNSCETGSTINGIFLNVEVAGNELDAGAIPNVYLAVVKNVGGNLTFPAPNAIGASNNKRYVIHQEMIMLENAVGGNPRKLFQGVVVIPKGMRRMAPNDLIQVMIFSTAINFAACLQCIYKEFN